MQIETDEVKVCDTQTAMKKPQLKVGSIIIGILLISIPIFIALCISMPQLWQALIAAKGEILKGMFIGASTLPVILFVAIKAGKRWYKVWWAWTALTVTAVAVLSISLLGTPQGGQPGMGGQDMYMNEGMMDKGMY